MHDDAFVRGVCSRRNHKGDGDGHFRLPFENGYHGFCIAYRTPDAVEGDTYLVYPTDRAINRNSGENIANYLKVFATQFSDIFLDDNVRAQHYVWHFSDDFSGWRVDSEVVQDIKDTASEMNIPDHGYTQQIGDTIRTWDFMVLDEADGDAIFFAYKYRDGNAGGGVPGEVAPPKTGDEANFIRWTALIAISVTGMTMLRKRREA